MEQNEGVRMQRPRGGGTAGSLWPSQGQNSIIQYDGQYDADQGNEGQDRVVQNNLA